jgi:hypothetical protein
VNFEWADITACKYDTSGNSLEGWTMNLAGPDGQTGSTDEEGCVTFTVDLPGDYDLSETLQSGWTQITPVGNNYEVTVGTNGSYGPYEFVNFEWADITACKEEYGTGDPLAGWVMNLSDGQSGPTVLNQTGDAACITFTIEEPGDYSLSETLQTGWTQMVPANDGDYDFTATSGYEATYTFENFEWAEVTACKIKSNDGTVVPEWPVSLVQDGTVVDSQLTGTDGCYTWTVVEPGSYGVEETVLPFWTPVTPTSWDFGPVESGGAYSYTFINYREPGCTLTQGYWKTHSEFGPAPEDDGWYNIGDVDGDGNSEGPNEQFFDSGQTWYQTFQTKVKGGNAYYILAHQYMAAMLNIMNGADPTVLSSGPISTLAEAEALLDKWDTLGPRTIPRNHADRVTAIQLADTLDDFNNGILAGGPPHCTDSNAETTSLKLDGDSLITLWRPE